MISFFTRVTAALCLLSGVPMAAWSQISGPPNASFEAGEKTPQSWKVEGDVTLDPAEKVSGIKSLLLKRDPVHLPETRATCEPFIIQPGVWDISGAAQNDLYSPDSSFNVSLTLECLDAAGKATKKRRIVAIYGKSAWRHFKERLDVPPGTVKARIEVEFNKTHGEFRLDALELKYIGESVPMEGGNRKVVFKSNRIGFLFYPGDHVAFEMRVETPAVIPGGKLLVDWQVSDFYGAPASPRQPAVLASAGKTPAGWTIYSGVLDAGGLPLKVGPYYELRTSLDLGAASPARDTASFAILPEAVTKELDPLATPFGAHTWNATVFDYFPLAARLGIRRCLVFWDFPATPPYTPEFDSGYGHLSRIAWPKRFGLAPYGVLYPLMRIEHGEKPDYPDEALREGVRQSIEKYKGDGLWGFQIGNEPPSWNPDMVRRDIEAYRIVYETIKKTDPKIVAIGSALGPNETYFKAGFQPYQDAYNIHGYADLGELRRGMKEYQRLFDKYGGRKPIWSTEIGSMSQGLPRDVIARDIVRKAICFLADGGGFFSWFAVGGMPDPEGERTGGYSDSMDLFAARHNMHLPRLDAVAYYHLINTLGTKTFVAEHLYPNGIHAFLYRDNLANSLIVLWHESGAAELFLPMPDTHEVALTWMNGDTRRLDAEGTGINLRVGEDPLFVGFRGDKTTLPDGLSAPTAAHIEYLPADLTQGQVVEVKASVLVGKRLTLAGPVTWRVADGESATNGGTITTTFQVTVPEDTASRSATFTLSDETATGRGNTELRFVIPVKSRIDVDLLPVAGRQEGDAAVKLILANRSNREQTVSWNVEIVDELPMADGTYRLPDARPSQAFFSSVAADKLTLASGESKEVVLPMSGTDRLAIYKLRATAMDATGNTVKRERRVGGFARVARATGGIKLDGRLDERVWREAPAYRLNEARQFCLVENEAKRWGGERDLSGTVRYAWDDETLYLGVEAVDDIFSNPEADSKMWAQDGLQILVDPFRQDPQSLGRYDYSMGLGSKGPQAWCHRSADPSAPGGSVPEIKLAVETDGKGGSNRIYEVAIPWRRLAPFKAKAGADLGLTLVINEDDGKGRMSTMGWFGGVHLKEALFVGDLILDSK